MKKLFSIVLGLAMFVVGHNALAAEQSTVLYKSGDKILTYQKVSSEDIDGKYYGYGDIDRNYYCVNLYLNNKALIGVEFFCGLKKGDLNFYKTSLKNIIAFHEKAEYYPYSISGWHLLDMSNGKVILDVTVPNVDVIDLNLGGNNIYIQDFFINNESCEKAKDSKSASKTNPIFKGFTLKDGTSLYKTNSNVSGAICSPMRCEGCSNRDFIPANTKKSILGFNKDLNKIYFSATGKDWTAYYFYDAKAKKIIKTTLAQINKDKVSITLVKKF